MEIEVGEWVRTKDGRIYKVDNFSCDWMLNDVFYKVIAKHSKNIIDLIQEGDYVNGYKVTDVMSGYVYVDRTKLGTNLLTTYTDYQIKSVVTKEQYKSIEYLLEEE